MSRTLCYVTLQSSAEGQASHTHVSEISRGLEAQGWMVTLVAPRHTCGGRVSRLVAQWRAQRDALRAASLEWDVVYVRDHPLVGRIIRVLRRHCRVLVLEVNGRAEELALSYPVVRGFERRIRELSRQRMACADGVVTVTESLADWVTTQGYQGALRVIPNGADVAAFDPARCARQTREYALFFGALAPWQGIDCLLAAVQRPEWPASVRLVIAGDGMLRPAVEDAASKCALIDVRGVVPHAQMPELLCGAALSIVPQNRVRGVTGSPLKLFESMAAGLPIVATDVPGQAEIVRAARCGIVVPPDDSAALACAVALVTADPVKRSNMAARSRHVAEASMSWAARASDTSAFLFDLLDEVEQ